MPALLLNGRFGLWALCCLGWACFGGATQAAAQELPSVLDLPGSRPVPLPDMEQPPAPVPLRLPPVPPARGEVLPEGVRVLIREVVLEGNSVLSTAEIGSVVAPFVGRELVTEGLTALRDAITSAYVRAGYVNSRATLPDQDLTEGVLRVRVLEGLLSDVVVRGNRGYRDETLRDRVIGDPARPLNAYELEERLRALESAPGIDSIRAVLRPGLSPDQSVLELEVVEGRRLSVNFDFGNKLNPLIGSEAGHLTVGYLNPLGLGDPFVARFGLSEGMTDVWARYGVPLGIHGTGLQIDGRYIRAKIVDDDFSFLGIESRYVDGAVELSQMLWSGEQSAMQLGVRAVWRSSRSTYRGGAFPLSDAAAGDGSVRASVLRFYQQWTQRMPNQALVARSTFSVGLELPGATSGPIDKAQFASWLGQLQWLYRFPKSGLELVLRGSGQLALDPLLPFERFSVGGYYSVRGYRENQLVRDNGVSLGLDVRLPLWRSAAGRTVLQAGPFVDFGRSWNHPDRRRHGAETLGSTGVAVAWSPWSWLRAEFTYGAQLADVERPNRKSLQDHGIGFRIFATIW